MELLFGVKWSASRRDLERTFAGQLESHPTQNALGIGVEAWGYPAAIVYYFRRSLLGTKLARANLVFQQVPSSDSGIEDLYSEIVSAADHRFGPAQHRIPFDRNDPPEFRHSEMRVWVTADSVVTVSLRLAANGFAAGSVGVAAGIGDRVHDPISKGWA